MKNAIAALFRRMAPRLAAAAACGSLLLAPTAYGAPLVGGSAQGNTKGEPAVRIQGDVAAGGRVKLHGSLHPLAKTQNDAGVVPATTILHGVSIVFSRSAVQQADLNALMKAQQDPASPLYHQWLTPAQFAARFGMAQADLDKVSDWLLKQGFAVERVSASRDRIFFSGTVAQVNSAFATELHYYKVDGEKHFAPSTELSVPAALSGVVRNVGNLDSFKPKGMHHVVKSNSDGRAKADFTSGVSGNHYVSPGDIATIYDIMPAYRSGIAGDGQSIAIVGQSDVYLSDIENFQLASGFATAKDPVKVLVPTTGNAGNYVSGGDEGESDLDLEWSSAIAPNATVYFVYTGDGGNAGVFDSLVYAIETRIAPVISVSYGAC
ncbi:MAG TPA: protease pro-enzyme activation domain-containing protein, partial [Acidobacteriaceae bacterium]